MGPEPDRSSAASGDKKLAPGPRSLDDPDMRHRRHEPSLTRRRDRDLDPGRDPRPDRCHGHRAGGSGPRLARPLRGVTGLALGLAVIVALSAPARARSEKTLAYPRDQVWATAVRFLVVDEHVKITEKDAEAGYVVFELRDDGKRFRGALEVITVVRDGRTLVRFVLQIEDRPSWLELAMLTRLETKLRAELGSPAPAPSAPPPPRKDEPRPDAPRDEPRRDDGGPPVSSTP